jgi:hypothetical protein
MGILCVMPARVARLAVLTLFLGGPAAAQTPVHAEAVEPSSASAAPGATLAAEPGAGANTIAEAAAPHASAPAAAAEIITDLARLPPPVARMRESILQAARSGDLDKLLAVMQANETLPVFSFGDDKDPIALWKASYPDSDGIEILAILIQVLETGFVHVDRGTPQEMYVWPYFVRTSLNDLTLPQKVDLFRIVTGTDYREMKEFGAYIFYRVGIAPDGVWHFFVAGD